VDAIARAHPRAAQRDGSSRGPASAAAIRRCAFTLTEVLICVAILAAIAAIAWPSLLGYAKEQTLRESAYRLTRELDALASEAERRGVAIAVSIDVPVGSAASLRTEYLDPSDMGAVIAARDESNNDAATSLASGSSTPSTQASAGRRPGRSSGRNGAAGSAGGNSARDEQPLPSRPIELPRGLTVRQPGELASGRATARQRPAGTGVSSMMLMADPDEGMADLPQADRRWLVAIYLPDGSVVPGTGVELTLGRLGPVRVSVEPALGRARATEPARDPMLQQRDSTTIGAGAGSGTR
jgi:prepilin-type N-terminal cleavage/methylation domain-containing protein